MEFRGFLPPSPRSARFPSFPRVHANRGHSRIDDGDPLFYDAAMDKVGPDQKRKARDVPA